LSGRVFSLRGDELPGAPHIDVGGKWRMNQDNGFVVDVSINQVDDQLDAFCTHSNGSVRSTEATGFVAGDSFELTITWDNETKGQYRGRLEPGFFTSTDEGILKGETRDLMHEGSVAGWESDRTFARP
jgi:hypothetical protein